MTVLPRLISPLRDPCRLHQTIRFLSIILWERLWIKSAWALQLIEKGILRLHRLLPIRRQTTALKEKPHLHQTALPWDQVAVKKLPATEKTQIIMYLILSRAQFPTRKIL